MSNAKLVQLFKDKTRREKVYPVVSEDAVFDKDGGLPILKLKEDITQLGNAISGVEEIIGSGEINL